MFRIPNFFEMELSFEDSKGIISNFGSGDLLKGMELMNSAWEDHCNSGSEDDDEFFEPYQYEVNAYNKVFSTFQPLFS